MKRREFITLLGGTAAWPLAARAQQPGRMRRIGVLTALDGDDPETKERFATFRRELERLGWSEGRNVQIDYRFAALNANQYPVFAKEIVGLQPDVILGQSAQVVAQLQRETRTIPIVFVNVSDPIGAGFVTSLARPSGNLTGVLLYEPGIVGKWLAMLKEIAPTLKRVALLANPQTTVYEYFLRAAQDAAPALSIELVQARVQNAAEDVERAITSFAAIPHGGLLVLPDGTPIAYRDLIIALSARYRLPVVYPFRLFVLDGGLMAYATDQNEMVRLAASYVDRILRGAYPTDLPVQTPTKYQTIVNLKTAKVLGIEVPPSLLVRADQVIE